MPENTPNGPTHVVTCFLLRTDGSGDRVLLVRRSERVRTYRGAWAAISGYLEAGVTPLDQAYTELREEASLDQADVALLRQGEPLSVTDTGAGLNWVVHPFLFRLLAPEKIVTDWEATDSQWVAPAEIGHLPTVPRLAEALASVMAQEGDEHLAGG